MIEPINDIDLIKELWKPYTREVGPIFKDYLEKYPFFIYKVEDNIVGLINYEIHDRLKEVEIGVLLVDPNYRGLRISTKLMYYVYKEVESLIKTLGYKFVVKAYQGLPNNAMYEHLSTEHYPYGGPKDKPYFKYILDIDHIERSANK